MAKKQTDWTRLQEELKIARAELFGLEVEPTPAPVGFDEMCQWLEPYGIEVDLPSLTITCRGLSIKYVSFWHDSTANPRYQYLKTWVAKKTKSKSPYIVIYQDEWRDRRDVVQWAIGYRLKILNDIEYLDARKLEPRVISKKKIYRSFLDANHLEMMPITKHSNYFRRHWAMGLYDGERLVAVGFVWYRKGDMEMVRFCTLKGVCVRGGFTKILKAFERALGRIYVIFSIRLGKPKSAELVGYKDITSNNSHERRYWVTDLTRRIEERGIIRCLTPADKAQFPAIPNSISAYGRAGVYSWKLWGTKTPLYFFQHLGYWHYANHRDPDNPYGISGGGSST